VLIVCANRATANNGTRRRPQGGTSKSVNVTITPAMTHQNAQPNGTCATRKQGWWTRPRSSFPCNRTTSPRLAFLVGITGRTRGRCLLNTSRPYGGVPFPHAEGLPPARWKRPDANVSSKTMTPPRFSQTCEHPDSLPSEFGQQASSERHR